MTDSKKPSEPYSATKAVEDAMKQIDSVNPAKHLPRDHIAEELAAHDKFERLKAPPRNQAEEELKRVTRHAPTSEPDDLQESNNKQMEQLSQMHAAQDRQLDERIRKIAREEVERFAAEQARKPRHEDGHAA